MAAKATVPFYQLVIDKLNQDERGNRWLIGKLKEGYGIELTDTQLSNRLKDIHPFREEEIVAVSDVLGIDFKN